MRIRVVDGDRLEFRSYPDEGGGSSKFYLDESTENKLYEFLLARQLDRKTAQREVNLPTLLRP